MRTKSWAMGVLTGVFLLAGNAYADDKKGPHNSGFLGNGYADLKEVKSPGGQTFKRWVSPDVTPGKYDSILVDENIFYPRPKGTEQLSADTLAEISAYFDEAVRRELGGVFKIVSEPGPKTLRLHTAITAAAVKDTGLKPYQLLPIAFIATGGKGGKGASLAVEYQAVDSESNKVMLLGMRDGTGLELKNEKEKLTLAHFKPVIDAWAKDARAIVEAAKLKK